MECRFLLRRTPLFFGFPLQDLSPIGPALCAGVAWDKAADGERIFSNLPFAGEELVRPHALSSFR